MRTKALALNEGQKITRGVAIKDCGIGTEVIIRSAWAYRVTCLLISIMLFIECSGTPFEVCIR
jgi:hypothetical protein